MPDLGTSSPISPIEMDRTPRPDPRSATRSVCWRRQVVLSAMSKSASTSVI
jgi:hypothetical protein